MRLINYAVDPDIFRCNQSKSTVNLVVFILSHDLHINEFYTSKKESGQD